MSKLYVLWPKLTLVDGARDLSKRLLQRTSLEYHVAQKLCGAWKRGPMSRFSKYKSGLGRGGGLISKQKGSCFQAKKTMKEDGLSASHSCGQSSCCLWKGADGGVRGVGQGLPRPGKKSIIPLER